MPKGYFHRVHQETPTRLWINNPSASDMENALAAGANNCTPNPSYCSKLLQSEPAYIKAVIRDTVRAHPSLSTDQLAIEVIKTVSKRILERFYPLYQSSKGLQGYVTIQDDPRKDYDAEHTVQAHLEFAKLGKNFMAKIPVIAGGCEAIEELVERNIPVCATEIFSIAQALDICQRYQRASQKSGNRPPFYVTHITGILDQYFAEVVKSEKISLDPSILSQAGTIIARKEYRLLKERKLPGTLLGGGARNLTHFTEFVGGDFHITINWSTAEELIQKDPPVEKRIDTPTPQEVVEELSAKLPGFHRAYEEDGMKLEEFADFGPVMLFKTMFLNGYIRLLDEIAETRLNR
ncbi:MAG: hypothetical protein N2509_08105 [Treponemataceae bacterium]|nr:hypothetical protein [Treponemataceae bacterium]